MNNNEIRREILKLLYNQRRRCASHVRKEFLIKNLNEKIDYEKLIFHIEYLIEKEYITTKNFTDGFITTEEISITANGMDLVENPEALNSEFPLKITNYNIKNSFGFSTGDFSPVAVNINNSFNKIYQDIEVSDSNIKEKIKQKVNVIEKELEKEDINKSRIKKAMSWLKINANWTIPSLIQILTSIFL